MSQSLPPPPHRASYPRQFDDPLPRWSGAARRGVARCVWVRPEALQLGCPPRPPLAGKLLRSVGRVRPSGLEPFIALSCRCQWRSKKLTSAS